MVVNRLQATVQRSELIHQLVVVVIVNVNQTVVRVLQIGETPLLRVVSPAPPVITHHERQLRQFGGIVHRGLRR